MEISLGEAITMTARNKPDAPSFVIADGSAHTYAQTNARVNRLPSALRAEGVERGDRLAVFSLDSHRYVEIVLAALKLGAVYVPLNYRLRRGEIDTLVKRAEPRIFFYDDRYTDLLEGLAGAHPSIQLFLALNDEYEKLLATGTEDEPPVVAGDSDVIGLPFTSGTTGLPMGVVQSQRMMKAIVTEQIIEYRLHPGEAYKCRAYPNPAQASVLNRPFGCVRVVGNRSLTWRRQQYPAEKIRTTYAQASAYLTAMKTTDELAWLNEVSSVPLQQAIRHQQAAYAAFFAKRARCPRFKSRNGRQCAEYTRSGFRWREGALYLAKMDTPLAFTWSWPGIDPASIDPSTVTVSRDPRGRWYVSLAVDIPNQEPLPATGRVAVVGVPDEHWSEIVRAWVTLRPGASVTADELAAHCGQRPATYKVPAEFRFTDALPVNASGKILKRELRTLE